MFYGQVLESIISASVGFVYGAWLLSSRHPRLLRLAEFVNSSAVWVCSLALVETLASRKLIGYALAHLAFQIILIRYFSSNRGFQRRRSKPSKSTSS